jgi:hypothetical protein
MRFRATIESNGKTATGFQVPDDTVAALGAGKRPPVRVTINGHTYRSTVASMGGRFMVGVSAENRVAGGIAAGDEVDVDLELDTQPREVTVPGDLVTALDGEPAAKEFFDGLSYSKKRWFVLRIEQAKKAETRERRVAETVTMLREGRTGN